MHARDTFYETRRTASELDNLRALAERGDVQFPAIPADALLREGEGGVISIWDTVVRELAGFDVFFYDDGEVLICFYTYTNEQHSVRGVDKTSHLTKIQIQKSHPILRNGSSTTSQVAAPPPELAARAAALPRDPSHRRRWCASSKTSTITCWRPGNTPPKRKRTEAASPARPGNARKRDSPRHFRRTGAGRIGREVSRSQRLPQRFYRWMESCWTRSGLVPRSEEVEGFRSKFSFRSI